jgi:hypothetical protein
MTGKLKGKKILLLIAFVLLSYSNSRSQDSPHAAMEENPQDEDNCLFCHSEVPKPGEKVPNYALNFEPSEACIACHSASQHVGSKEHLKYTIPQSSTLPGDENNKVACFSCHDPHPQGIIEGRTVYEADLGKHETGFINQVVIPERGGKISLPQKTKVLLRLPLEDNKLCVNCHVTPN